MTKLLIIDAEGRVTGIATVADHLADRYVPANAAHATFKVSHGLARKLVEAGPRRFRTAPLDHPDVRTKPLAIIGLSNKEQRHVIFDWRENERMKGDKK